MILMCAWCKEEMKNLGGKAECKAPGKGRLHGKGVSHGICLDCRKRYFPETLRSVQENAKALVSDCLRASSMAVSVGCWW